MVTPQRYRLRAPASGREIILALDEEQLQDGRVFYDRETDEKLEVVAKLVPSGEHPSELPRAPENLRVCPHCEELVELDLSDCPFCGRRMPALHGDVTR